MHWLKKNIRTNLPQENLSLLGDSSLFLGSISVRNQSWSQPPSQSQTKSSKEKIRCQVLHIVFRRRSRNERQKISRSLRLPLLRRQQWKCISRTTLSWHENEKEFQKSYQKSTHSCPEINKYGGQAIGRHTQHHLQMEKLSPNHSHFVHNPVRTTRSS